MTAPTPPCIFLSYARADGKTAADRLREHLATPALTANSPLAVWQDLTSMHSGQWREQIRTAIKNANHLLLVLSPDALKSEVCAWEWHVARLEGAETSPVLADPAYDLATLPKWMTAQHIYRLDLTAPRLAEHPEWQRLLTSLRAPPTSRRMPTILRTPGERFVPRPDASDALRDMLLDARGDAVGITTAFIGSGGMGKTTLAIALAHDQRIQTAFYDGQLLVELGQQPNLLLVLRTALHDLTGENSDAETVKQASEKLAAALADRRVLLVIDDVWHWLHLEPFLQGGPNCARLVTTRDEGVLAKFRGAKKHITVDQLSEDQAVALLGAGLGAADIAAHRAFLLSLANRLGRCALLLELANGRIWTWAHDRGGLASAVDEAEIEFRFKGVTAFDIEDRSPIDFSNPATRNEGYADSIAASLGLLSEEQRIRFLELAIFPEDTDIPYASIALFWAETAEMDERATFNLLDRLKRMSLVKGALMKDVDPITKTEAPRPGIRLHDVIRSYARDSERTKSEVLADLNRRFWKAHIVAGKRAFADGTAVARYAYERLPWHLHEAHEYGVLDALLLKPAWLQGKLEATLNPQLLVTDYASYAQGTLQRLIGQSLRLAARILTRDRRQLLPQLFGRLLDRPEAEARIFFSEARTLLTSPAIVPIRRSLTAPGPEVARLEGHDGKVNVVRALPGDRLVSGSEDGTIRLWDLNTDREIARMNNQPGAVLSLASVANGQLAAGSHDGTLEIWDLNTFAVKGGLKGHRDYAMSLAVLPDGRLVSGSVDNTIRIWDTATFTQLNCIELNRYADWVSALVVLPDGRLASGHYNNRIRIWDIETGQETAALEGHRNPVLALAVLPDGRLASGSQDGTIRIWDVATLSEVGCLEGNAGSISALVVLPDGRLIAGCGDTTIRLWDVARNLQTGFLEGHAGSVNALAALPDGRFTSGPDDKTIRLWDPTLMTSVQSVTSSHYRAPWSGRSVGNAFAALDEVRIAYSNNEPIIRIWNADTGLEEDRLEGHSGAVVAIERLAGDYLSSVAVDGSVRVWDLERRIEVARLDLAGRISPDWLGVAPHDAIAMTGIAKLGIWHWKGEGEQFEIMDVEGTLRYLVPLSDDRVVHANAGNEIHVRGANHDSVLAGHHAPICGLFLTADGRLVSAARDNTVRLWDIDASREIACLEFDSAVEGLSGTIDGHLVVNDALGRLHWLEVLP